MNELTNEGMNELTNERVNELEDKRKEVTHIGSLPFCLLSPPLLQQFDGAVDELREGFALELTGSQ